MRVGVIAHIGSDTSAIAEILSVLNKCDTIQVVEARHMPIVYHKMEDIHIPSLTRVEPFRGRIRKRRR